MPGYSAQELFTSGDWDDWDDFDEEPEPEDPDLDPEPGPDREAA